MQTPLVQTRGPCVEVWRRPAGWDFRALKAPRHPFQKALCRSRADGETHCPYNCTGQSCFPADPLREKPGARSRGKREGGSRALSLLS